MLYLSYIMHYGIFIGRLQSLGWTSGLDWWTDTQTIVITCVIPAVICKLCYIATTVLGQLCTNRESEICVLKIILRKPHQMLSKLINTIDSVDTDSRVVEQDRVNPVLAYWYVYRPTAM